MTTFPHRLYNKYKICRKAIKNKKQIQTTSKIYVEGFTSEMKSR